MLQVSLFDQSVFSKSTTSTAHNYTHSSNNTKKVTELDMPLREQEEIILSWKQQVKSFILQRIKFRPEWKCMYHCHRAISARALNKAPQLRFQDFH